MAHTRNFAELGLPDIDSAPQEYQTPDLIDDDGVSPPTRSTSASSSYKDLDEDDELEASSSRVERPSLHPSAARSHFARSKVDARRADFSDRLHPSRHASKAQSRSYRVSSRRRRRKDGGEEFANGRFSDEDDAADSDLDEETLEQRIARLKREVEEVQAEAAAVRAQASDAPQTDAPPDTQDAMASLSSILKALDTDLQQKPSSTAVISAPSLPPTSTPTPTPTAPNQQALQQAAQLEARLATLESALGLPTSSPFLESSSSSSTTTPPTKTVLASLSLLETQLSIISATTAPSLDSLSRQIASLTQDAQRLAEARSAAATAATAGTSHPTERPRSVIMNGSALTTQQQRLSTPTDTPDETARKVTALHAALPQIERLAPLLPAVLERLRTLRVLHAQAGVAGEQLTAVEKLQAKCAGEIRRWQEGLTRVEQAIASAQDKSGENKGVIEAWVKELEARVDKL